MKVWSGDTGPCQELRAHSSATVQRAGQRGSAMASTDVAIPTPALEGEREGQGLLRKFDERMPHKCPPPWGVPLPAQPANHDPCRTAAQLCCRSNGVCLHEASLEKGGAGMPFLGGEPPLGMPGWN